jgi:hypothetical protein
VDCLLADVAVQRDFILDKSNIRTI